MARGDRPQTLAAFLNGASDGDLFDTRCLSLWEGDRLAGFSLFDVGADSAQSLIAAYDPELARYSLGLVTLLLETRWARRQGLHFHYAGYVVPGGTPSMDYKLRPRGVEYLDPATLVWRPWAESAGVTWPAEMVYRRLEEAARRLQEAGFKPILRVNPHYDIGAGQPALDRCLAEPLGLDCMPHEEGKTRLLATWNLEDQSYDLLHVALARARFVREDGGDGRVIDVWVVVKRLATAPSAEALEAEVRGVLA